MTKNIVPKAINTEYKGFLFRSRLEARWAIFFDALGIKWEYEPEGIQLEDGTWYLPDFYLSDFHSFFEVKRSNLELADFEHALKNVIEVAVYGKTSCLICFGDPVDDKIIIFCEESNDGGGGEYIDAFVTIGVHPETHEPFLLAYEDKRPRSFFTFGYEKDVKMTTLENGRFKYDDFVNPGVQKARKIARQARFEHGESISQQEVLKEAFFDYGYETKAILLAALNTRLANATSFTEILEIMKEKESLK